MCLALPSRVLRVEGMVALVEAGAGTREVSLMLLDEPVAAGDYVLVQHGRFAFERLDAARAREALDLIEVAVAAGGDTDLRSW
jgi:hydrogenase expression/formation protein HypC